MDPNKKLTSADLAKTSSSLAILGYSISLLALERADQEEQKKESMTAAMNYLFKRFQR